MNRFLSGSRTLPAIAILFFVVFRGPLFAQPAHVLKLDFKPGDVHHVVITEVLRLAMHFPQVDEHDARPSIRTSVYSFTETIDSLSPNGFAYVSASLDSFRTGINFGEGPNAENFFRFNSAQDYDIQHELHDIKVLPRAQFLGHILRFVMRPDGTIARFINLQDFHDDAVGKGYDYDMVHAMLSLTDSLRMGQLLELGFGGLAAQASPYTSPSTATEIPITRTVSATPGKNGSLEFHVTYFDPPKHVDYLEGIATPLGINRFYGAGHGALLMRDGFLKHSLYKDTALVQLQVDIDTVPEQITRTVTTDVYPVKVLHGIITLKEVKVHKGVWKDPNDDGSSSDGTSDMGTDSKPVPAPDSTGTNDSH